MKLYQMCIGNSHRHGNSKENEATWSNETFFDKGVGGEVLEVRMSDLHTVGEK